MNHFNIKIYSLNICDIFLKLYLDNSNSDSKQRNDSQEIKSQIEPIKLPEKDYEEKKVDAEETKPETTSTITGKIDFKALRSRFGN